MKKDPRKKKKEEEFGGRIICVTAKRRLGAVSIPKERIRDPDQKVLRASGRCLGVWGVGGGAAKAKVSTSLGSNNRKGAGGRKKKDLGGRGLGSWSEKKT